jgi:hypothetical protein
MNQSDEESESIQSYDIPKCPWCPFTGKLKQVLRHMESEHYKKWCELALYPPIAGGHY